ncbi:hypothetical protein C1645_827157 [Glomus cerebriforme]|uniref:Uncharacterized protein n=1 Tax=Glomus cerebriforme TaxID=658196 RepID=A0A397SP27_9GLOM|nr:hypothetical protein C1645_827157 [Glomus cerebriforme]
MTYQLPVDCLNEIFEYLEDKMALHSYLYTSPGPISNSFHKNVRAYNNFLACTSFGADIDKKFQRQNENHHSIMQDLNNDILQHLLDMLDECNPYIKSFHQARDIILSNTTSEI